MPITCLTDMDGCLCDFVSHALATHGRKEVKITTWNIEDHLGITAEMFQEPIQKRGAGWWRQIPELPWYKDVIRLSKKHSDEMFICSSPHVFEESETGKRKWVRDRLGKSFDNFVFTNHKHLLASPTTILIDDSEKNCAAFDERDGISILFPAAWNRLGEMKNPIPYLERQLEDAAKKIRAYEDWKHHTSEIESLNEEEDFDF